MTIQQYLENLNQKYIQGNATEHTFRGLLEQLIESILPDIRATNEPKRQSCGAPDYILTRGDIPVGFIEAKDIGDSDLKGEKKTGNKEQFDRYKASLPNLIFTDYLDFHLYRDGKFVTSISIGELTDKGILAKSEHFSAFENLMKDFCVHISQTIKSSKQLAEMMAGKARLLSDVIGKALVSDEINQENSTLKDQMKAFKDILIHDITPQGFADVYAQTIVYGMFCARLHDPTLPTFSRQEGYQLIPKSNPFLKKLFGYIAGLDLDDRIVWIVESLVELFLACNVEELLQNYGKQTKMENPIIHFYEDFLSEYDPKLRKSRGVWYTPAPVVHFIVRAVDDILKTEFNLPQGLADTTKTTIKVQAQGTNKPVEQEVHKVQILDPATGTGTFLAEVIRHIHKRFEGQQGIWTNYVEQHLIPRLNGFELLMASYAMAHLQLDLLLTETQFKPSTNQRIRVFLTNSLEESHPDTGTLFANWLSAEANEANQIKRDTSVMCVIGNPPYAVSSTNKGTWIQNLIADYKKNLNERKINLDDDYIKFIRYGQYFIDKNGSGVLAYISNNSFIDGITHRQMRKSLLESFDKIYILDLHGNTKKKEVSPDGSADQNVFDIMQGVSINIFVKTGKKFPSTGGVPEGRGGSLAEVFHYDLQGKREFKYYFLNDNSIQKIDWDKLDFTEPNYFFVPKNFDEIKSYEKGFQLDELFSNLVSGFQTKRDKTTIAFSKTELENIKSIFDNFDVSEIRRKLDLPEDGRDWTIEWAKKDLKMNNPIDTKVMYRPFDERFTYFTGKSKGFVAYPRAELYNHLNKPENISLITCRQISTNEFQHIFLSHLVSDMCNISSQTKETGYIFPLYLYPDSTANDAFQSTERKPNLNMEIVNQIAKKLNLKFTIEKHSPPLEGCPTKEDGVVHKRNTKNYMNLPFNPDLKQRAKELRQAGNLSEVLFWNQVKNKQFKGYDFDRQKVIGNYIVDFYCSNCNVVIEIDGSSHDDKLEYDKKRDEFLEGLGLTVIHINVQEVFNNMDGVMEMLMNHPALADTKDNNHPNLSGSPPKEGNFAPIDILDYIYAVLHSPNYREKYKEFLKIDFPRVPYPKDKETFWQLVKLGGEIREIHLLESLPIAIGMDKYITQYPIDGDHIVRKIKYIPYPKTRINDTKINTTTDTNETLHTETDSINFPQPHLSSNEDMLLHEPNEEYNTKGDQGLGKVYINETQFFDNVPEIAWNFYIGGYQPAQKWLKDRKDRKLEFDDILHYQKIIVALTETDRLMKEIDTIEIE